MSPKVTFTTNQTSDTKPPRMTTRRACEDCRQRKRRCNHQSRITPYSYPLRWVANKSMSESSHQTTSSLKLAGQEQSPPAGSSNRHISKNENTGMQANAKPSEEGPMWQGMTERRQPHSQALRLARSFSPTTSRYVGDLNPEARLLEEKISPEDLKRAYPDDVGLWIHSGSPKKIERSSSAPDSWQREPACCQSRLRDLMSHETVKTLSKLYFANVHPIIPLLNEVEYWQCLARCAISTPLVHAVCLIAAKDSAAEKDLRLLKSKDEIVPVRQFCSQLFSSVTKSISQPVSMRKVTMMRVLGLVSLHQEGSDGAEQASSYICQAIHYAQSLALHLPRPHDIDGDLKRAFWCLWALDRLNSAINSRPCFIADMDIAVSDLTPKESGHLAFSVWLRVTRMLNKVIGLYRPNHDGEISCWDDSSFPVFEQIMDETNAWHLPSSIIATLHIFYLATSILAHRLKNINNLPTPTPSRLRQQLAAIQVIRYMQNPTRLKALHPLPIVVYAASLALSVSYQQLRYSRLACHQEDALQDFNTGCGVLQELRQKWCSADAMAVLAKKISGTLDKLPRIDILRLNQSAHKKGDGQLDRKVMVVDQRPDDIATTSSSHNLPTGSCLEAMNLFAGMDDMSWMYADADNPSCFDGFPEFDDLCSTW